MPAATFDALDYFEKLKAAGVPEEQAKAQANALRDFASAQMEANQKKLTTKGDLEETELRLQKEIEQVRMEIEKVRYSLLKWQIGIAIVILTIMAKGFGWIGF